MKKVYYYIILAVAVVVAAVTFINRSDAPIDTSDGIISPSPTALEATTPTKVVVPRGSTKPTPGIIVQEITTYERLAKSLDELNRRLALDESCTAIVPSQVQYMNNTEIMLDNTASAVARIVKIAGREYSIGARSWIMATLSSSTLPAHLAIYCGDIELGRLTLVAQ